MARLGNRLAPFVVRLRKEARRFPAVPLVLIGAGCGLVAVLFHHALQLGRALLIDAALASPRPLVRAALVLLLPTAMAGLLALAVRRLSPGAGGGLALVRRAYAQRPEILNGRTFVGAFLANPLSLGAGTPLGPEGPTVVLTSTFSSGMARLVGLPSRAVRGMIPIGTAAGISAIFNTPITGVVFGLEEVVGSASRGVLGGSLVAAVAAAVVQRQVLGGERLLPASAATWKDPRELVGFALVGLVAGGVAGFVPRLVPWLRSVLETSLARLGRSAVVVRGCVAGLGVGLLGLVSPETLGTGYRPISAWLTGGGTAGLAVVAFLAKSAGLVVALAGPLVGGVFAPSLFIGASLGAATGHAAHQLFPGAPIDPAAYALVGMGAFFAGFLRTPLAAVLIVFELTGDYALVLPLMLAVAISSVVARRISRRTLVEQQLEDEGVHAAPAGGDPLSSVLVSEVMSRAPVTVRRDQTLLEAARSVAGTNHPVYPVVDDGGWCLGLLEGRDLDAAAREGRLESLVVGDVMRGVPVFATPEEPVDRISLRLGTHHVTRCPVVASHEEPRLVGFLGPSDLLQARVKGTSEIGDSTLS